MPRIRTIKPETASDEKLATVSRDARLTFVYLITQADDDGLILASPRQLLGSLFPHDADVTEARVVSWCEELAEIGCVRWRATRGGSPVLELVNWAEHQKIKHRAKPVISPTLLPYTDADSVARTHAGRAPDILPRPSGDPPEDVGRPSGGLREDGGTVSPTNQQPWTMDQLLTVDHGPATNSEVVDPAVGRHRSLVAAAANQGVDQLFGEAPLTRFRWDQAGTFALCEALAAEAMPLAFALRAVFTAASTKGTAEGEAPRSLKYYAPAVVRLWRDRQQREADQGVPTPQRLDVTKADRPGERQPTEAEIEAEMIRRIEAGEFLPPQLRELPA